LVVLDLSQNHLESIPVEICELKRLEVLNLNKNDFKEFPGGIIADLERLKRFGIDWIQYSHYKTEVIN